MRGSPNSAFEGLREKIRHELAAAVDREVLPGSESVPGFPAGVEVEQFQCVVGCIGVERRQFGLERAGQLSLEPATTRRTLMTRIRLTPR